MKRYIIIPFFILLAFGLQAQFMENFTDGDFTDNPGWEGDTGRYVVSSSFELQNMDTVGSSSYLSVPAATADSTTWEFYFRLEFSPSTSNQMRAYLNASQSDLTGPQNAYFLQAGASGGDDALELYRQDGVGATLLLSTPAGSAATDPEIRVRVTRNQNQVWELLADLTGGTNFQSYGTITDGTHPMGQYFGFSNKYTSTRIDKFFFDDIAIAPLFSDVMPPVLVSANASEGTIISLQFNEPLDAATVEMVANYSLSPATNIISAMRDSDDPSRILLTVAPLESGTNYTITATGIADEAENIAGNQTQNFLFIETIVAEANDILINEIMADPAPQVGLPLVEFVELYNRSDKFINLENFTLSDANSSADPLPSFVLAPDGYVIICEATNVDALSGFGPVIGLGSLPALNNSEDRITLNNSDNDLIHSVLYKDDWYRDAQKAAGGWTLELINPNLFCVGADNWMASNDLDGGTPGRINSVLDNTPDNTPPAVVSATATSDRSLSILFSEFLSELEAEDPANYIITPGNFSPVSVTLDEEGSVITANFVNIFVDRQEYTLTVNSVSDCTGNNISTNNTASFAFFLTSPAERYDVIINEIYAAPTPSHGLPALEFVELYNRSDKAINLENYIFDEGSSSGNTLPFFVLLPDAYVILQKADAVFDDFSLYGDIIKLERFALTNGGETLTLIDPLNNIIDAVEYDDDWYVNGRSAGYSLERINSDNICTNSKADWSSSFADIGGTPGSQNDIFDQSRLNNEGPVLKKVYMDRDFSNQVILNFDQALDEMTVRDLDNYTLSPSNPSILNATLIGPLFNEVSISLNNSATAETIYTIAVALSSCKNNASTLDQSGRFAISEVIEAGDLILNEVLVNPLSNASRFIELYNKSDKVVDIRDLFLAKRIEFNAIGFDEEVETPCLFFPNEYIVLTPDPADILARYEVENPNALISTSVPSYDDDEDQIVLLTSESVIVDELAYTRSFNNALLDDRNGVSLERIDPNEATQNIGNWASAAETAGFATPTYQNSQFSERAGMIDGNKFISLEETTISPDGDGFQDALIIAYQTTDPGFLAKVNIYDARGRLVKKLNQQTLVAAEGSLKWDGSTDDEAKAPMGIYVLVAEFIHPDGRVQKDKETIVVAGRLE